MSILFLDPLVLTAYGALGVGVWLVWTGSVRWWFGHDATWTLLVWPLPLVTGALPVVAAIVAGLLGRIGIGGDEGGAVAGAVYLGAYMVPWLWLSLAPPRWLLPPWARARLARAPAVRDAPVVGAVPALYAWRGRGHAARSRWVWAVDAVAGFVWVEDGELRFRAADGSGEDGGSEWAADLDDELVSGLQMHMGDELRLESPRGGWWTRRSLDVDLAAIDGLEFATGRPWTRGGLLTMEVEGRRPLRLWLTDAASVRTAIANALGPAATA